MIGQETIDQVRTRTSLVQLIGETVKLQRRGRSHVGLCPFHQEKTPSFHVNDERNFFHCFGCGRSGDALKFVEETEGLSFVEAVRRLAERSGIPLVETESAGDRAQAERARRQQQRFYDLLGAAALYFERCLDEHPLRGGARAELERRGLPAKDRTTQETLQAFRIGYAPFGWDGLLEHLKRLELHLGDAEALGLIVPRKQGQGYYDRFRHRLMFAVLDSSGRVVAFSGRALTPPNAADLGPYGHQPLPSKTEEPPAKYVNSPESALYRKRDVVFGLYQARQAIRTEGNCIVVEGNFDVVSLYARGIKNVVAPLGTAFTAEQAKQIRRLSPAVTLLFDGDSAGQRAARGAREACRTADLRARVATLPSGTDPDEVAQKSGALGIKRVVEAAQGMLEFLIESALDVEFNSSDLESRAARIREVTELLATETDPAVRAMARQHADRIAVRLGITDARTLQALTNSVKSALAAAERSGAAASRSAPGTRAGAAPEAPPRVAAPGRARSRDRRIEIDREVFGALLDFPGLLDDSEVNETLDVIEGDAALGVAALRRDHTLLDISAFCAPLPEALEEFARARLAAPRHTQAEAAKSEILRNLRTLKLLELGKRKVERLEEITRVQRAGDYDREMELLEEQVRRSRERLGI